MKSHLDIQINGKSLVLPDDFSLSAEESNPVFNDVSFFSYPCSVPTKHNMAVLKNIANRDSNMRGMDFEHAEAKITADGLPLNTGQVITSEDAEIGPSFDFNIDAQKQSFSELIGDLECQDVKVKDRIVIGEKIGDIRFRGNIHLEEVRRIFDNDWNLTRIEYYQPAEKLMNSLYEEKDFIIDAPQALGFSYPAKCVGFPSAIPDDQGKPKTMESYINVSRPYPFPYCNARVAYAHPDVKTNDDGTQETEGTVKGNVSNPSDKRDFGQYWCLDADRPQSGVCFYVLYFLDCLFEQLGIAFNKDELLEVEDMKRLCFFTTQCRYDEEETSQVLTNNEIQQWLDSRGCGGKIGFAVKTGKTKKGREEDAKSLPNINPGSFEEMDYKELSEECVFNIGENFDSDEMFDYFDFYTAYPASLLTHVLYYRKIYGKFNATTTVNNMIANSENFPKESVKSVIDSLEASFGIRFLYDADKRIVTACFLRNIFKDSQTRKFNGKILPMMPINEKITGIRMIYDAESDKKEQRNNVRYGIKDYDTEFDYIEFPQDRTVINLTYNDIIRQVNSTNRNVYVDQQTGNVYRIKIDSEAKDLFSLHPVLFRVAQYKGVEIGDCSEKNDDFVKEFSSGFRPLAVSIINALDYNSDRTGQVSPIFAPVLDVDMEHEFLPQCIESSTDVDTDELSGSCAFPNHVGLALKEKLILEESYDPTQTDDGNSPLQEIDWGLSVTVMRGGGNDSEIINYDRGYDGFDNSRWRDTIATYEMYSDTMGPKGDDFDYNGIDGGDGGGERFSLSIRTWVQPSWAESPLCIDDERDQQGHIIRRIRSRGLCDSFMPEYFYFLLNRKKYKVKARATIAQLLDIRNHWKDRYIIDGKIGFIDRLKYNIKRDTGVSDVEIDFFAI